MVPRDRFICGTASDYGSEGKADKCRRSKQGGNDPSKLGDRTDGMSNNLSCSRHESTKGRFLHTKFWAGLSAIALMGAALAAIQSNPALAVGTSWTALPAAAANNWTSVAHGNGVWVAVSANGTVMRSVDDGSNWTAVSAAETNQWRSVAYGNGVWVAVANNGANRVMRSTDDGVNWTAVAAAEANE
ncbi:hypothetical protein N8797_00985, partial [Pontimonas sp.]|nr:hypothetical protein [Pontimonas sp.]